MSRGDDGAIEDVFFNFIYQPLRDERGLTRGIMMFADEVTEQVNARRRVEHLADELREHIFDMRVPPPAAVAGGAGQPARLGGGATPVSRSLKAFR